jgi:hypothetical protein
MARRANVGVPTGIVLILLFCDRVQVEPVFLPSVLSLGANFGAMTHLSAPPPSGGLAGMGMHPATSFGISPSTGEDAPTPWLLGVTARSTGVHRPGQAKTRVTLDRSSGSWVTRSTSREASVGIPDDTSR